MNILLVAFEFPPLNSGGSRRPWRFAEGLAAKGHHVTVFTANYTGTPLQSQCDADYSLPDRENVTVERLPLRWSRRWFAWHSSGYSFSPDGYHKAWKRALGRAWAMMLDSGAPPDLVILTMPPFSLYAFAKLVRRTSSIPIVVDMRDHWSLWVMTPFASRLHYELNRAREGSLLRHADLVLTVTPEMRTDLLTLHKGLSPERVVFCPNSFDEFRAPWTGFRSGKDRCRIGYFGAFYYFPQVAERLARPWYLRWPHQWFYYVPRNEDWKFRSPFFFFQALDTFLQTSPEFTDRMEVVFAGRKPVWFDEMLFSESLRKVVRHLGPLSAAEALSLQDECDVLLLTSVKVESGKDYCIAGKTFEFFAASIPIWGFVCDGSQQWILQESGVALLFDPERPGESAGLIRQFMEGSVPLAPNVEFLNRFRTDSVMNDLEGLLEKIVQRKT
jgi:glycosyltransferase involved in cell wall biosynthesis